MIGEIATKATVALLAPVTAIGAAAPLAQQPWLQDMLEGTGKSLALAFLVAAFLTVIFQCANAVCVFGIGLACVGVISVDQAFLLLSKVEQELNANSDSGEHVPLARLAPGSRHAGNAVSTTKPVVDDSSETSQGKLIGGV